MYPPGAGEGASPASGRVLTKLIAAALAAAAVTLAGAATASAQAILAVDPVEPCYREQLTVHLMPPGYGPNAPVVFTRSGRRSATRSPPTRAERWTRS